MCLTVVVIVTAWMVQTFTVNQNANLHQNANVNVHVNVNVSDCDCDCDCVVSAMLNVKNMPKHMNMNINIWWVQNVNAYVVGDHYTAPWEFPPSKKHLDQGKTYMQALTAVLKEQGTTP